MVEPLAVPPIGQSIAAGACLGTASGGQVGGSRDLVEDDRLIADDRSDDRPAVGPQGVEQSVEIVERQPASRILGDSD